MSPDKRVVRGRKSPVRNVGVLATLVLGFLLIAGLSALLVFPDFVLRGIIERRVTKSLADSHPEYAIRIAGIHCELFRNRIACDSLMLWRTDSTFSCTVESLSVGGISWLAILRGGGVSQGSLGSSIVRAGEIDVLVHPSGYRFRVGGLRISLPDSELVADNVEIGPSMNDGDFFGESQFRKTRISFAAKQCRLSGAAYRETPEGVCFHARSMRVEDVIADVLINKDKRAGSDNAGPMMPGEILSSIQDTIGIDSLILTGGRVAYCERMTAGRKPAILTFDALQAVVTGMASHPGPGTRADIAASGVIAGGGTLNLSMAIPLSGAQCTFHYSGSLSGMDLSNLNSFIEVSDDMRIKSGKLTSASFDIDVRAGSATGNVRAVYTNLIIASINGRTGSESGVVDRLASWVSRNVKIRGSNTPDGSGALKTGAVKYTRTREDPFLGFTWFALRSGIGDVVGF